MKLRTYNDLHLDHYSSVGKLWYPPELPDDKDTILILAGDLWIGTRFIEYAGHSWISNVAPRFKQVLIVLGNHDYWPCNQDLTILRGAEKCNSMLQDFDIQNVKVLDCDTYQDPDHPDILFVGATLWTDMKKSDPLTMHNMSQFMAYDGKIAYETGEGGAWSRFTSEKWIRTHNRHRDYIKLITEQNPDKKIVVITHHLPLETLGDPRYIGNCDNYYYYSDLSNIILDNKNIMLWLYGHSHFQKDTMMVHCRFINNAVGYISEMMEGQRLVKH